MKIKGRHFALCGLFCALLAISSKIQIPTAVIPFTLQSACFLLCILSLPSFLAPITIAIYLLCGLIGLPFFAQGGGFSYLLNPSFGYLIGFWVASIVKFIAFKNTKPTFKNMLLISLICIAISHLFGNVYCYLILTVHLSTKITLFQSFIVNGLYFIPTDLIWAFICPSLCLRLIKK